MLKKNSMSQSGVGHQAAQRARGAPLLLQVLRSGVFREHEPWGGVSAFGPCQPGHAQLHACAAGNYRARIFRRGTLLRQKNISFG